ncbi:protein kinase, putative [Bodo saltans]|uniref:Protein kinase, putative n=1 Tax=Bodo saltans TaxID=75058 RepID=A0A0S4JSL3_BODSA|nr:protein kinase, putative [Bodo saltans]|eukprot:CUG93352.1 protein kinase, putative [Bodo saltans]
MQKRKHEKRASLSEANESELRQRLSRYSYNGESDKQASMDARAVHEAVLAAIDTPSERSSSSAPSDDDRDGSTSVSSPAEDDDDEDENSDEETASDDDDDGEEDAASTIATSAAEEDGNPPDLDATLDDILGSPTAAERKQVSPYAKLSPGPGLMTMGEQTASNQPAWAFQEIAAKRSLRLRANSGAGVSSEEESPDRMIQRLLNSSSGGVALRAATTISDPAFNNINKSSPMTISKSSSISNRELPLSSGGAKGDEASSSFNSGTPGRKQSESLSMIQELHRSYNGQLPLSLQPVGRPSSLQKLPSFIDPNNGGFASLNSTGIAPSSTTLSSPPSMAAQMEFKKGRELGRGGFGVVFQAVLSDGRLAAVKQLPTTDQKGIDKEMKIMCNLPPHPHCVQYMGTRKTKHHMYMVMEFVSGGSIHALRQEMGKFTEAVAKRYAHMTLLGLLHLHTHHIVHQDIKGGNVLLDERGSAKIADFGCIRELSYGTTQSGGCISTQGGGGGTPLWMAPEVCRGERASTKSDVWSFGCFVLEMLNDTGLPWSFPPGTSLQGAGYAIGSATQPPPFPPQLSDFAKDFLSRCLAVHPQQRAGVEQLLRHPFLTSEPLKIPVAAATDADFLRTVQSMASEASAADHLYHSAEQSTFRLEAASDDDDDDDVGGVRPTPLQVLGGDAAGYRAIQGVTTARRAVDQGHVVWRSAGEMKVHLRPS